MTSDRAQEATVGGDTYRSAVWHLTLNAARPYGSLFDVTTSDAVEIALNGTRRFEDELGVGSTSLLGEIKEALGRSS